MMHSSNQNLYSNIDLLKQLPGMVFIKNHDLVYTATSTYAARLCGFKDTEQFIGHNDYELRCEAYLSAEVFREEDRKVMQHGKMTASLQLHTYSDNLAHIFLVKKSPLRNQANEIIGICGMADEISNPHIGRAIYQLTDLGKSCKKEAIYSLTYDQLPLSPREAELLFYLVRGFTNKEIGQFMQVSPRTVESYLVNIKIKFQCDTRYEVLHHCLAQGFNHVIPSSMINRCLNQTWLVDI